MACPFRCDARVHVEGGKDCCHLQIHDAASHQADHEKDWTGDFKHFNLSIMEHVGGESDCEEYTDDRDREHGDSVEEKRTESFSVEASCVSSFTCDEICFVPNAMDAYNNEPLSWNVMMLVLL